jgi:acyl-coenzyme A thioesterase PaaI-like protein
MPSLTEFLGAELVDEGAWRFHVPRELHGAFGGAFGGIVAACALVAGRSVAPGRVPNAVDCRFVRGLPAGDALARANVLHGGRSLSTVSVDVTDTDDRLCTRATVSLVDRAALDEFRRPGPSPSVWIAHEDAEPWPAVAPIVTTIDSRIVGNDERGIATAMRVPWDVEPETSAEAASMAADMAVGPPIGSAIAGQGISGPNPDLSLRFCGDVTTPALVGVGRLERAEGGVAAVRLEVWSNEQSSFEARGVRGAQRPRSNYQLVALGIATALLLPLR